MFWGMTLEPGKLYTEVMGEEVQLSMAAIDSRKDLGESPSTNFCQIVIQTEKGEYVLCTLVHGVMFQQSLDLKLMPREKVTFSVQGPSVVYLVGYTASYPEDEDEMGMQQEDYEDDSTAWETFDEAGDLPMTQIKEEPVEILDDSDTDVETDNKEQLHEQISSLSAQGEMSMSSDHQTDGAISEPTNDTAEEDELLFSIATVDNTVIKTEAPDMETRPPVNSGVMASMDQQQLTSQGNIYGSSLPQASTSSQDYFYPDNQQHQSDATLAPPVSFQPITSSGPDYQDPQSRVLPPTEPPFLTAENPLTHGGPIRHSAPTMPPQAADAQRTYPSPRRQFGSNQRRPPRRGRPRGAQSRITQPRGLPQQPVGPGTSQQGVPGPSSTGPPHNNSLRARMSGRSESESSGFVGQAPAVVFCKYCAKAFTDISKYRSHESYHRHRNKFPCEECGTSFHSRKNLLRHQMIHTGEKPFRCGICGLRFSRNHTRKMHEKNHYKFN